MNDLFIAYTITCILYSAFIMITIYIPIIDELKYIVRNRWGSSVEKRIKRFSIFYLFIAWLMGVFFAPYLVWKLTQYGHSNVMKHYKEEMWKDVRLEALEITDGETRS